MYQSEFVVARLRHLASRALTRIGTLDITCKPAFADLPSVEAPQSSGGTGLMGRSRATRRMVWSLMVWLWQLPPVSTRSVCSMPLYNETVPEQNEYVVKAIQALYKNDTRQAKRCLTQLIDTVGKIGPFRMMD